MAVNRGAPGALEIVRAFVNSKDVETDVDRLESPAALREWLVARGLGDGLPASLRPVDVRGARRLREAIRELLIANNDSPAADRPPQRAAGDAGDRVIEVLDRAARRARLELRFDVRAGAAMRPAASGVAGALGRILAVVAGAMADGTWSRLKVCRESTCRWAFYDRAKNRSRTWCSMKVCGNRAKVRQYRGRQK